MCKRGRWHDVGEIQLAELLAPGPDGHEGYERFTPGSGVRGVRPNLERDGVDESAAVGLEDLVDRAKRDLMDYACVPVLAGFLGKVAGCDLVSDFTYL